MFKFEYRYYEKYSKRDGFGIVIESKFNSIEILLLNNLGMIKSISFFDYDEEINNKIDKVLNTVDFRLINSNIYSNNHNDNEKMIYFENDKYNRKVEGNDIFSNKIIKDIFNSIKDILKDVIVFSETCINKDSDII